MVYSSERYYRYLASERTTTTVELLVWCQCYSNKIIITAWFYRLGNLILVVLVMMQPFNFCEVYSIIILRLCSFKLCRVFILTKCFVIGEKWLWNVLLDCFQLPGKSVFSAHKHARNVALKWLSLIISREQVVFVCRFRRNRRRSKRSTNIRTTKNED